MSIEQLVGTWEVRATTFPMWLSGKRLHPRFTYGPIAGRALELDDDVSFFTPKGEEKHIRGTDQFDPGSGAFSWRGRGLLRIASSRWKVDAIDADAGLLAISFSKTLFTPAGVDILAREGVDDDVVRAFAPEVEGLAWL